MKRLFPAFILLLCVFALSGCSAGAAEPGGQPASTRANVTPAKTSSAVSGQVPAAPPAVEASPSRPPAAEASPPPASSRPSAAAAPDPSDAGQAKTDPEEAIRTEVAAWKTAPYREDGTTRKGIGNSQFVAAVFEAVFGVKVPAKEDDQRDTGKLVIREDLQPGDLVFFESGGIGPFIKTKTVGLYVGHGDVALARDKVGVTIVRLADDKWDSSYKTARRVALNPVVAPTFDASTYGSNRGALLHDVAEAWSGTLYKENGTTFDGIGNDEFVREVYGAIYEADLEGTPKAWETMGKAVSRKNLAPGDIVFYEAGGVGGFFKQTHVGLYIGSNEFVASVKGSAVTILKLTDRKWGEAYKLARRINPDVLTQIQEARAARTAAANPATAKANAALAAPRVLADDEKQLRDNIEPWIGTPYKLGGTSKSGIDCSAFVREMFTETYHVDLPRTAEQQETLGAKIDRKDLQTGDLVFFRTQGMGPFFKSRHVGIYLGGGEFAQASGSKGVTITRLDQVYWSKKYKTARRLLPAASSR